MPRDTKVDAKREVPLEPNAAFEVRPITGPSNAKTELMAHIEKHEPKLLKIILGVETVDHPTDNQLVAYARKYFKSADQMQQPAV